MSVLVPEVELKVRASEILSAAGVPEEDAQCVADCLLFAERRGIVTHGLMRLKHYVDRLEAGGTNPRARVQVVRESPSTALVDGDNGLGAVLGTLAMTLAIDKARQVGSGVVVVREMNHLGAAAYYALMAAEHDMIGISTCNVPASMAPTGASTAVVGNNPLAIAFPSRERSPIVWDAAMSKSSWGALYLSMQSGDGLVPEGAFLDADGHPTRDARAVLAGGSLVPIAGYKGYGLALCMGLLSGVLADAPFDSELPHPYHYLSAPGGGAAAMIAIDVGAFRPPDDFVSQAEAIAAGIHDLPPTDSTTRVWLPGEKEADTEQERRRNGIPVSDATLAELGQLRRRFGISAS
jgi:LDH2 family malate/lactate/ureidoglycolate dehydrogenase